MVGFIGSVGLGLAKIGKLFTKDKKNQSTSSPAPPLEIASQDAYALLYDFKAQPLGEFGSEDELFKDIPRPFATVRAPTETRPTLPKQSASTPLFGVPLIGDESSFQSYLGRATMTATCPAPPAPTRRRSRRHTHKHTVSRASLFDESERSAKAERRKKTTLTPLVTAKYTPKTPSNLSRELR